MSSVRPEFLDRVQDFVADLVDLLGLDLQVSLEEADDHVRINLTDGDGEPLLRRKGEALDALQHVVNAVFRHEVEEKRLVVDCLGFRHAKDRELRQMVHFLVDKARTTGMPQTIGPLNSYARRLVHLEVGEMADMESISEGTGATKVVVIQARRAPAPAR
jgi:predicted RNA-binding protein Jag